MNELKSYLTFIEDVGKDAKGRKMAKYNCVCGKETILNKTNVKRLNTKSCGCMRYVMVALKNKSHGKRNHPLYGVWNGIKRRCYEKSNPAYKYYGGNGIYMCEDWKNNFNYFYDWCINNGWQSGLEIDKDIKGGKCYSPENCLIVTSRQNCNARSTNRIITINKVSKTLAQWAHESGIPQDMISRRINKNWDPNVAINTDKTKKGESNKKKVICLENNKVFDSIKEAAKFVKCAPVSIGLVCMNKRNSVFGHSFKYINS